MPQANNHKPATYNAAFKQVEAMAETQLKERLNRQTRLLCETETICSPVERELAQARVLQAIAKTNAALTEHSVNARYSNGG